MKRPRIGLALGSGSARGWSHIGVIEGLAEAGLEPDIVCGCSIGALVGAAYVADRLARLKDFAEALTWGRIARLLDIRLSGGGLISGQDIVALLREMEISASISSYRKPFAAVATDLETGREVWLQDGPIDEAVRASISLPGILSPTRRDKRWLVDGGLVNPVPVSVCRALGADVVIAVNLNDDLLGRRAFGRDAPGRSAATAEFTTRLLKQAPRVLRDQVAAIVPRLLAPESSTPGYFEVLMNSINVMQDRITRARLAGEPPEVLLAPRLGSIGLLEFNRASEAIAEGKACLEQALPLLQRYV